jgi:hypothetical protein
MYKTVMLIKMCETSRTNRNKKREYVKKKLMSSRQTGREEKYQRLI